MKVNKHLCLFSVVLVLGGCTTASTTPSAIEQTKGLRQFRHAPFNESELSEFAARMRALEGGDVWDKKAKGFVATEMISGDTGKKVWSADPLATPSTKSKHAYKGINGHRHIKDFTAEELSAAKLDEFGLILRNKADKETVASKLERLGYEVLKGPVDNLVVKFNESGVEALKRHFDIIDKIPEVKVVAPRFKINLGSHLPAANDTEFLLNKQWGLSAINAVPAWDNPDIRNSQTIIAIVDTGVKATHEDLKDKIKPGIDSTPTVGYTIGTAPGTDDGQGHGTHVAGCAAASTGNGKGIAGTAWGSYIMPIAVNETRPSGDSMNADNVRAGGMWAIDNGAKVLNLSLYGSYDDVFFRELADYALSKGVPIFACMGNGVANNYIATSSPQYPAALSHANMIAVGAINDVGNRTTFSNYGSHIDIAAPGQDIYSTTYNLLYDRLSGTSMATPIVAGVFASLWHVGRALPYWQIRDVIYTTASNLTSAPGRWAGDTWDQDTGYGLIKFGEAEKYLLRSGLVYRWTTMGSNIHSWSKDPTLTLGSHYEGIGLYLQPLAVTGTVALYSRYNSVTKDTLLTTNASEGGTSFVTKEVVGYIAQTKGSAGMSKDVFRLYHPTSGHMFTTSTSEKDSLMGSGWVLEGVVGYAL